ncbi:MAG: hypothetical protein J7525_19605 [Roseofilum sp. SID3]|uniref:hypothetical protein n=1 Tax=Roseofilum sp. SID3 TaxID=2821499 RepID=UPI001AFD4331|nr:hypothetical protein [Roseofilum sp. SID3]MBP0015302.1 hypothetical protein [Roseofilum sp. SID3]
MAKEYMSTKLPTTFTTLNLGGLDIKQENCTSITREMVDVACAVLQKNRIGIVTRSVQAALKHIYGIGGGTDAICRMLREWRTENLSSIKQGSNDKDIVSALMEATDDGLLEEEEIPKEYLDAMRQMAIAGYHLAYQNADTSISGDRIKTLAQENDVMKEQLKNFPQMEMELGFYKSECDRQRDELREAYLSINKQQLADSDEYRKQVDRLNEQKLDLEQQVAKANQQIEELEANKEQARLQSQEYSELQGQLDSREREISSLHAQLDELHQGTGEKKVLESQLNEVRAQLASANETITNLQAQQVSSAALEVDTDVDTLIQEIAELKSQLEAEQGKKQSKKHKSVVAA